MSIFMKATIELNAYKVQEFLEAFTKNLVPLMEDQGWRLHGCFVEKFGSIKPSIVIDLWEMEDILHVERVMKDYSYRSDPRYIAAQPVLEQAVISEKLEFMELYAGRLGKCY